MHSKTRGGLVYSTDGGRMCPGCRRPLVACGCAAPGPAQASDGIVRVARETRGRAGKGVTVIGGLALAPDALAALGKRLKAACCAGGTAKGGMIEIQGDHRERVIQALIDEGWTVKRSGG